VLCDLTFRSALSERQVNIVKWAASLIQIVGYAATAFGMTPLNLYLFLAGVIGWFAVGVFWNDKAIMVQPVVRDALEEGMLIPVLEANWCPYPALYAYFAQDSQKARRIRVFLDFLSEKSLTNWI